MGIRRGLQLWGLQAFLLSALLGGCFGTPAASDDLEFHDVSRLAFEHATAWRDDARLAGAGTVEATDFRMPSTGFRVSSQMLDARLPPQDRVDHQIGDGRGLYWNFIFIDPSTGDRLALLFIRDGSEPVHREEFPAELGVESTGAMEEPRVTSEAAVAKAFARRPFERFFAAMEDPYLLVALIPGEQGPVWTVSAFARGEIVRLSGDAGAGVESPELLLDPGMHSTVVVDALDGSFLHAGFFPVLETDLFDAWWFAGFGGPGFTTFKASWTDTVDVVTNEKTHSISVVGPMLHGRPVFLAMRICVGHERLGDLHFRLDGPGGTVVSGGIGGFPATFPVALAQHKLVSDLEEGTHVAYFSVDPASAAMTEYRFEARVASASPFAGFRPLDAGLEPCG